MRTRLAITIVIASLIIAGTAVWYTRARQSTNVNTPTATQNANAGASSNTNITFDPVAPVNDNGNTNQVQVDQFGQYE